MNDPEGFLSRWSRRKREAEDDQPQQAEAAEPVELNAKSGKSPVPDKEAEAEEPPTGDKPKAGPTFDVSNLPTIESISAETDIRAFLAPGVPPALTQAALRRAWVVDPKIRDFIEIAENQWDFTAPGVPGFDLSPPTGDIKRMLAQIFGTPPADESSPERKNDQTLEIADAATVEPAPHRNVTEPVQPVDQTVRKGEENSDQPAIIADAGTANAASQNNPASQDEHPIPRRGHGGAMPR
jgi:hypothetical protein